MVLYKNIVYSTLEKDAEENYCEFHDNVDPNSKIAKHMMHLWGRKHEWCLAYRLDVLSRANNTNNYADATLECLRT
jgi:hypothetical protein